MADSEKRAVRTDAAPAALGPYSQAVRVGNWLFCSGQLGLHPDGSGIVAGGIRGQAERCLLNLQAVLEAGGASFDDLVKTTIYLADLSDFEAFNEVYAGFVGEPPPARATVGACGLPKGALVEVEGVAWLG